MGIDIGGRAEIRVAEPFLDLLQRHAVGQQQAGTAMAKIMKPHSVVKEQPIHRYVKRKTGKGLSVVLHLFPHLKAKL